MKVCLFGCKSTTLLLARNVQKLLGIDTIVTIAADKAERAQVADYHDIAPWCADHNVTLRYAARYDQKDAADHAFFEEQGFDVGFVAGWQRLVPTEILRSFSVGVFGMHGSAADLPIGRGRSPMNWSLIEGRKAFYTNMFKYDPGVDDGDILDTLAFSISDQDTAETLHYKNTLSMIGLIKRNLAHFQNGTLSYTPQKDLEPTYYPKRTPDDSLIDWTSPVDVIERFIRAVAPPFNGAFTYAGAHKVSILRAAIFELDTVPLGVSADNWGEIAEVLPNGKFLVKVPGGLLIIHDYKAEDGFTPVPGMMFTDGGLERKTFPTNAYGGYDLPEST